LHSDEEVSHFPSNCSFYIFVIAHIPSSPFLKCILQPAPSHFGITSKQPLSIRRYCSLLPCSYSWHRGTFFHSRLYRFQILLSCLFPSNITVANRREMTVVSYHSTLISDVASQEEAADKTSSQIFLSRGVAGADADPGASAPRTPSPAFVMSVFESPSSHLMTLGNAAARTESAGTERDSTPLDQRTNESKNSLQSLGPFN
jgi:hypothetical protein